VAAVVAVVIQIEPEAAAVLALLLLELMVQRPLLLDRPQLQQ
jgi:hypothetical protein